MTKVKMVEGRHYIDFQLLIKYSQKFKNCAILIKDKDIYGLYGATVDNVTYVWNDIHLSMLDLFGFRPEKIVRFNLISGLDIVFLYQIGFVDIKTLYLFHCLYEKNPILLWLLSSMEPLINTFLKNVNFEKLIHLPPIPGFKGQIQIQNAKICWKVQDIPPYIYDFMRTWKKILKADAFWNFKYDFFIRHPIEPKFFIAGIPVEQLFVYNAKNITVQIMTLAALYDHVFYNYLKNIIKTYLIQEIQQLRGMLANYTMRGQES